MPGRPLNDESEERAASRGSPRGRIPFGALFLIATVAAVFVYGIVLKATGPAAAGRTAPRTTAGGEARAGADDPFDGEAQPHKNPILPEPSSGAAGDPAGTSDESPASPSVAAPSSRNPFSARDAALPPAPAVSDRTSPPLPPGSTPGAAPARPAIPASPGSAAPPREPSIAPRGSAPAAARRKAREMAAAKNYGGAAQAWDEWARTVPASSWTVQVAAVRLEKPGASRSLDSLLGREDAFALPPGALPNGLSPVCVGTYDSEQAARRAAAAMGKSPGSSSPPIVKPLSALRPR